MPTGARCLLPSIPSNHHRPERLTSALARLDAADLLSRCQLMAVREASDSELAAVHSRELIDALAAASTKARTRSGASASSSSRSEVGGSGGKDKGFVICADAMVSADTYLAARLAAGAAAQVGAALAQGWRGTRMMKRPTPDVARTLVQSVLRLCMAHL